MSSEQPSTEEIKTSAEAANAESPADQNQTGENQAAGEADASEVVSSPTVEESQAKTTPEPAPVTEKSSAESHTETRISETDQVSGTEESAKSERKVQLRPKVDPEQFKAVPSPGSSVPLPQANDSEGSTSEVTQESIDEAAMLQVAEAATPIDIPPEIDEIDQDLEAELAAALSDQGTQELPKTLTDEEIAADATNETTVASTAQTATPGESTNTLAEGDRLKGKVESINNDDVFVDLGSKALGTPGIVPLRQFGDKAPQIGQEVDVKVTSIKEAEGLIVLTLPRGHHKPCGRLGCRLCRSGRRMCCQQIE